MTKKQQQFIDLCDPDLTNELVEEEMLPRYIPFKEFKKRYQQKHKEKYGCELKTSKDYSILIIPIGLGFFALLGHLIKNLSK